MHSRRATARSSCLVRAWGVKPRLNAAIPRGMPVTSPDKGRVGQIKTEKEDTMRVQREEFYFEPRCIDEHLRVSW